MSKGVARFVYIRFFYSGFYNSFDKIVPQSFRNGECTYHGDLFLAFRRTEESQRALLSLITSRVILVQNPGAACPGP